MLFVMMSTDIEKKFSYFRGGTCLDSLCFFLAVSSWNSFFKIYSGLKLKIYIDPSTGSAGSEVRIKNNRPKGKIVLKTKTKRKKNSAKKKKENRLARSRTRFICPCKQPLDHCTIAHIILHINFVISKQFFPAIDAV